MITTIIPIPIYKQTLQVLFGDRSEIAETMESEYGISERDASYFVEQTNGCEGAIYYLDTTDDYYLWMPNLPILASDYGVLVHELQHLTFTLLENKGMTHSMESDEAYSYLLEYLFVEVSNVINSNQQS